MSARLDEVAEIVGGATPRTTVPEYWDGEVRWVTPADLGELNSRYILDTPRKITAVGLRSCAAEVLPANSVLLSSRAPIGHVAINLAPMATNQGFKSIVPDDSKLHSGFVYWWLKANTEYLQRLGNGATFKEISKAVVSRIQIPLPPLDEQRRIAAILDQADDLTRKRRLALEKLNALPQAIFQEMFGDPVSNPKGWPQHLIAELGRVVTGNTPPRVNATNYGSSIEWIKSDNINTPSYYVTKAAEALSEVGAGIGRVAPRNSILVTCIAGSPSCIGNSAMTDRAVAFNQQINAFIPRIGNAHFYYAQLRVGKRLVQAASTDAMKGLVSKSRFEAIRLIVPPIALQDQFASFIAPIESLTQSNNASLMAMDQLFSSLQHHAFSGTLTSSVAAATLASLRRETSHPAKPLAV